ncbi:MULTISPECIES: Gfo/Idh/MocA family oxidoreductase [unclassified Bradyrhizobium]|uniref:Gfo/Idh/MocA family protein n=1 Tax=unclassified Bradyrhizobium TaxID=2631580 RepID=UPI00247A3381|nr:MULTISPECIES: Gfo/Idh/MocA family oxidoreductase [unclassified Bradyrhizobium]WGS22863.1 Gfo/Idh/MocA family oxidoreductase [Bradyrhizobium sp. ISRA463]WGS29857.1 Gfo/Idh/MocA family oxidoreductase [Bradyrhizobium sp. ISRA464]
MIRFGLLGCGRIAKRHSDLLGGNHIAGASLVAVCDPIRSRADAVAGKFEITAHYAMDEFLARKDIDAVAVLTPSGLHPAHVIACAKAGKHVVVEKPMALRLQDADDMIRACDEAGVKMFIVKQNRFNVPVVKAREALDAGRFGKLILGTVRVRWCRDQAYYDQDDWRGTWAYDGGVLTNQASHHVDMLEWFFGDVVSVHARASTALARIETEDTAVATLKFRNGALGIIEATTATRPTDLEGSFSILGERGTVEISGFAVNQIRHWRFIDELPSDKDVVEKFSVNPPNVYGFGHQAYYRHVVDCLVNQRSALVDGLEGRKSLELISALYESIETGAEVALRFTPRLSRLGVAS